MSLCCSCFKRSDSTQSLNDRVPVQTPKQGRCGAICSIIAIIVGIIILGGVVAAALLLNLGLTNTLLVTVGGAFLGLIFMAVGSTCLICRKFRKYLVKEETTPLSDPREEGGVDDIVLGMGPVVVVEEEGISPEDIVLGMGPVVVVEEEEGVSPEDIVLGMGPVLVIERAPQQEEGDVVPHRLL